MNQINHICCFLNKEGDFYYETDGNSLIQEKDNTYNVKVPDIEGEYDKDQFIEKVDFVMGLFVKLELYSASAGTYLDHFPKIITVSNDGNLHVFTEEMVGSDGGIEMEVGEDAPTIEKELSTKELKEIKEVIEENQFFSIPKDVTDYSVQDGDGSRITVYEKGQQRKVGGENSSNKHYNAIEDSIFDHVRDEYADWEKETQDYLKKLNEY